MMTRAVGARSTTPRTNERAREISPDRSHLTRDERLAALYDPSHVVQIDIAMAPSAWDTLRTAAPRGGRCNFEYTGTRYDWVEADAVTIDGHRFETPAVKKRSFCGSMSDTKPALKIKLDKLDESNEKRAKKTLGTATFTLSNAQQDPALVRQPLGMALARKAGLPAPRCNLAEVRVNGDSLGVYANVEPIDEHFVKSRFGEPIGDLYELAVTDFVPNHLTRLTPEVEADEDSGRFVSRAVRAIADQGLLAVGNYFDQENLMRLWAFEIVTGSWDGYANSTNNTYAYVDPSREQVMMIPWGLDQLILERPSPRSPLDIYRKGKLTALFEADPASCARLAREVQSILDKVWVEPKIHDQINRFSALALSHTPEAKHPAVQSALVTLHSAVDATRAQMESLFTNQFTPAGALICHRPENVIGIRSAKPLDAFEPNAASGLAWNAAADTAATGVEPSREAVSPGEAALALRYHTPGGTNGPVDKAIFEGIFALTNERGRDLSGIGGIALDLYVPQKSGMRVSLALSTGPSWTWQETMSTNLEQGWNRDMIFPVEGRGFRALDDVRRLSLKLGGIPSTPEGTGAVLFDNLRIVELETATEGFERGVRCVYPA